MRPPTPSAGELLEAVITGSSMIFSIPYSNPNLSSQKCASSVGSVVSTVEVVETRSPDVLDGVATEDTLVVSRTFVVVIITLDEMLGVLVPLGTGVVFSVTFVVVSFVEPIVGRVVKGDAGSVVEDTRDAVVVGSIASEEVGEIFTVVSVVVSTITGTVVEPTPRNKICFTKRECKSLQYYLTFLTEQMQRKKATCKALKTIRFFQTDRILSDLQKFQEKQNKKCKQIKERVSSQKVKAMSNI